MPSDPLPKAPNVETDDPVLPKDIQEHLGRKLRAEFQLEQPRPAFLGDDALPPEFAGLVREIERRERSSQKGLDAIRKEFGLPDDE